MDTNRTSTASKAPKQSKTGNSSSIGGKWLSWPLKGFFFLATLFASLSLLNYFLLPGERLALQPIEKFISRGSQNLTYHCMGPENSNTLIFVIPGAQNPYYPLLSVMHQLAAQKHRVCSYNRPQRTFTGGISDVSDVDAVIQDLHHVIQTVKGSASKVALVGHSLGGLIANAYALSHPKEVHGIVGLDPVPTIVTWPEGMKVKEKLADTFVALEWVARLGVFRFLTSFKPNGMWFIPEAQDHWDAIHYHWNDPVSYQLRELAVENLANFVKNSASENKLTIPIRVVLATSFGLGVDEEWRYLWEEETVMRTISDKTTVTTLSDTTHLFPTEEPARAVAEILALLPLV